MSRMLKIILVVNLVVLAVLAFTYPHLMISPGKVIPGHEKLNADCFACHAPARQPWDFVCEEGHGCEAIPVTRKMIGALQRSDPRCGEAVLEEGDSWALFKLNTLVLLGKTKAAISSWF